jgi:hypothetical protein
MNCSDYKRCTVKKKSKENKMGEEGGMKGSKLVYVD